MLVLIETQIKETHVRFVMSVILFKYIFLNAIYIRMSLIGLERNLLRQLLTLWD